MKGCDYAWERPDPVWLYANGYRFACRYISYDTTGKNLTTAERDALHAAGLSIVLNWEYDPRAALNGRTQGVQDATEALRQANALGAPATTPIYFSLDFDVQAADLPAIKAYLSGIAGVIGPDRVGVYGGYFVVLNVALSGYARYGWQTYAWSGGSWFDQAEIRQTQNGVPTPYGSIDVDESTAVDFGQWKPDGTVGVAMDNEPVFSDPAAPDALAWRVDALQGGYDIVRAGPRAGETMWLVTELKAISAKLDQLLARPLGSVGMADLAVALTGTMSGTAKPTVTP